MTYREKKEQARQKAIDWQLDYFNHNYYWSEMPENAPKIEALMEFLNKWKESASEYYHEEALSLYNLYTQHEERCKELDKISDWKEKRDQREIEYREYNSNVKLFSSVVRELRKYTEPYIDEIALEKLLSKEVKAKYEDLVCRISDVVGEIKDCNNLRVAGNGIINGIVIGSLGKAKIDTITAGGYNVNVLLDSGRHGQCLHYRVLVNKLKENN